MPWYFYGPTGAPLVELLVDNNPVGAIIPTTTAQVGATLAARAASAKEGYLFCNGAVLNISTYPELGALLGATYGGNGTTTFAVPDLTSTFIMGAGGSYPLNTTGGALTHQHGTQDHAHNVSDHRHTVPGHSHTTNLSHSHSVPSHQHGPPGSTAAVGNPPGDTAAQITIENGSPGAASAGTAHTHGMTGLSGAASAGTGTATLGLGASSGNHPYTGYSGAFSSSGASPSTGLTDSASNLPSYIEQNYMIKYKVN